MSPEQARGSDNLDFRTDIWSFCVVLYEALAGDMPFDAPDGSALLRAVIQDPPKPLALVRGVDRQLWSLIEHGLSKAASLRPSSMTELGRELARWLRRHGVETDAAGTPLDTKWLPRTGLARVSPARTLELATADTARAPAATPTARAPLRPFGEVRVPSDPARRPPPQRASTFEPVTRGAPARPTRKAKKANPKEDHLLVLSATVATLMGLFVAVVWGMGAFDDEPRVLGATAGFDPNAAFERVTAGMAAPSEPPGTSLPAPAAPPAEATPKASSAPPPSPAEPPPPPEPPAEAPPTVAVDTAAPIATPVPAPRPAEKKPAVSVPAPRPATAKAPPSLTTTLNSLAPPPPKRPNGGDGRAAKLRTPATGHDLMVPY
jgi:serine/threonine-protein kinase